MDSSEHVCPVCGQPVETVIRRYKTLGAWVPRWVAGPCRNRACEAYVPKDQDEDPDQDPGVRQRPAGSGTGAGEEPEETAPQTS
ncbi:hypothetical protein [Streptomyces sp. HGB0020]|uniref:hypothetical protein n=1 Tax=Streptomyces sp. HGB0020 TaxID=1078086 RepID=UPI00056A7EC9|nr:hypothetical protein [Streptomyces sp. HGB0020]